MLAGRLGYVYVDTGALYRGVAYEILNQNIDPEDDQALDRFAAGLDIRFTHTEKGLRLVSSGEDISDAIRTPEITMLASRISAKPIIRKALLGIQKQLGLQKAAVFEGRDMGTVVFPEADVKFFLTAELNTRAMRRFSEYPENAAIDLETVLRDMKKRDENDSSRAIAPLKPAEDAVIVDSTAMPPETVVDQMIAHIFGEHN
jgi:CMP/dCMP kinase